MQSAPPGDRLESPSTRWGQRRERNLDDTMHRIRTLLVDDNEVFLESLTRFLPEIPEINVVPVGFARSGEEAVRMAGELKPDLILMDLAMPGIGGLEATRILKARHILSRIILVTVHGQTEYEAAARSAGADGFVAKSDFFDKILPLLRAFSWLEIS